MEAPYLTAILADDEPAITEGLSSLPIWKELGIKVIATADSGEAALGMITAMKPDFAIMDIMMPGMTGLEVLEELSREAPGTDIIILSGYGSFDYARTALRFQAKAYLLKPVDTEELRETLADLTARRTAGRRGTGIAISRTTLNDLADGRLVDPYSAVTMLSSGDNGLPDAPCFAMVLSFQDSIREGTVSVLEEATKEERRIFWNKDARTLRALFSLSMTMPFAIAERCLSALEDASLQLPRIAIGSTVSSPATAAESFSKALLALSYQLYDENGRIFTSDIIAASAPEYKPADSDVDPIIECILANDRKGIEAFSASFIQKLLGQTLPPPNYVYSITNWLIRSIGKRLGMLIDGAGLLPDAPGITRFHTIGEMEKGLTELFTQIASYIAAVYGEEEARRKISGDVESDAIIRKMAKYIEDHTEEQIRLEDIAETVNLSPSYAAIYFRKKTGTTIREYILKEKMEEARRRLVEKDASVSDIAYRLGYHDYRSFSRAFKNLTGMTPSEFQEESAR